MPATANREEDKQADGEASLRQSEQMLYCGHDRGNVAVMPEVRSGGRDLRFQSGRFVH